jgi:DNA topoisomerase-3
VKPTIRAALEAQLNLISQGRARFESVLSHAVEIFQRKFKYYVENIGGMDELFEASFSPLAESGKPLTKYVHDCGVGLMCSGRSD